MQTNMQTKCKRSKPGNTNLENVHKHCTTVIAGGHYVKEMSRNLHNSKVQNRHPEGNFYKQHLSFKK